MNRAQIRFLGFLAIVAATACSDVNLFPTVDEPPPLANNKISLEGRVCTADPDELTFPVKVLFVVDTSSSMDKSDPVDPTVADPTEQTRRSTAIKQVIEQFLDFNLQFAPTFCNTGVAGCGLGETTCATCGGDAYCLGVECCPQGQTCTDRPPCPPVTETNGQCAPLCSVDADCQATGDRCIIPEGQTLGVCGRYLDPGVEFALERFGAAKQVLTKSRGEDGFTNDPGQLAAALPQLNITTGVTDYEGALSVALKTLSDDMIYLQDNDAAALGRTRYVVIFLSDGDPDPQIRSSNDWNSLDPDIRAALQSTLLSDPNQSANAINEYNIDTRILKLVNDIVELKTIFGAGDVALHTAFLSTAASSQVEAAATTLLDQMARIGNGTFRNFNNGEDLNFLYVGFSSLRRVFKMSTFLASNINARPTVQGPVADSDGDGLSDEREVTAGTLSTEVDSDGDGFSDALEHFFRNSGADALDPTDADCPLGGNDTDGDGIRDDTDGDGLLDCEERFLGTNRFRFDSDGDGMPDWVEVRFGTNPAADDVLNDNLDFDNMPNGAELRLHTDPAVDDAARRSRESYRYSVQRTGTGIEEVPYSCESDADCPAGNCQDNVCECESEFDCRQGGPCVQNGDCTFPGETCQDQVCRGRLTCRTVPIDGTERSVCTAPRHITCYDYTVQNVALVTAQEGQTQPEGWNSVVLYFGQQPFDSPQDQADFQVACVNANYIAATSQKNPADGRFVIPESAWQAPNDFQLGQSCLCPDGSIGNCY